MSIRVAYSLEDVKSRLSPRSSVVTLGVFDGVHRGHRQIIDEVIARRDRAGFEGAYLITFDPHPVIVTRSRRTPSILTTIDERLELFSKFPLDGVFVVKFDEETARIDYRVFLQRYLLGAMDMKHLVLGYDHHFGYRREGSPDVVAGEGLKRGFGVSVVPPVEFESSVVSSTNIRSALQGGDVATANRLLGHSYLISGRVVGGTGRGKEFGFPTANVELSHPRKLWPPNGVYAVSLRWGERRLEGMMNVGTAPTVRGGSRRVEVHIFDFAGDIYGETLFVYCEAYMRGERKFPSEDALVAQLEEDRLRCLSALESLRERGGTG